MKSNTLVSCAVAAAIAAAAASAAHATNITSYQTNQNAGLNVNVFVSGSTAVDNTLASELNTAALNLCQSGTVNSYTDNTKVLDNSGNAIGGAIEYVYYCQAGSASGVSTNLFLAIFKESTAGSINGAQPLIQVAKGSSSGLTFLNPTGPDVQAGTCAGPTSVGTCTASDFLHNVTPTGGVADVEANLLRTVPGGGILSSSDISNFLASAPGLDIVWGVPVSKNLYYALQTAEGLATKCGGNFDSPTCAPSLSKEQVAGLYDRDIVSWTSLGLNNTVSNAVNICRRDVGSGTEASFEYFFLGARCSTSSEAMASQDGRTVIEQASTGNILRCLRAFDQGDVNVTPYNQDFNTTFTPFTPAGGQWAIGIASSELKPAQLASFSDTLRMIAVDGVLPSLENVVNGYDPFWGTDTWYHIPSGHPGSPEGTAAFTVFSAIQGDIGHPIPTAAADSGYKNVWGDGGDLAPASLFATSTSYSSYPVGPTAVLASPINLWTKAASGVVNNCDTPVLWRSASGLVSPAESTLLGSGPNVNLGP
ncbi:MAG: type 2 periplasmic-binding domain-containing protein [Steroidobacteraceae bacterium]